MNPETDCGCEQGMCCGFHDCCPPVPGKTREDTVTMRVVPCDGYDGDHGAHPYDWTGVWLWCEGSES